MINRTSVDELRPGGLIPSFKLEAATRSGYVSPWDYKGRNNLVLFFLHDARCAACSQRLQELAANYSEYRKLNSEVIAVARDSAENLTELSRQIDLGFPLLSDEDGKVSDSYIGQTEGPVGSSQVNAAVFIVDRWGALFSKEMAPDADSLPKEPEIYDWLSFIEIQCPECFPPEWPEAI